MKKAYQYYDTIAYLYFDAFVACLHGSEDFGELTGADYSQDAVKYLLSAGMQEDEISALIDMITKD